MNPEEAREQALRNIRNLQALRRKGRTALVLFIVVSLVAMLHFMLLPAFPQEIRVFLGAPPPTWLITLALSLYGFSALVLTLGRLTQGEGSFHGWSHLGYISSFYAFFYYAGELADYFWGVFTAGLTIMVLENYRLAVYADEGMRREREVLARLDRGHLPPAARI
jgi:hypothetical protein